MKPVIHLTVPGGVREVLLHCCCAPCSSAIVECLLDNDVRPTLFFCNPNIFPEEEYLRRKNECVRHATALGLAFVDADDNHDRWVAEMQGLEEEPERGRRCLRCFTMRLRETARYAAEHGFSLFATTLASSRWKDLAQIRAAGCAVAAEFPGVEFWDRNWRKEGLQERRRELIAAYRFYNQSYCGCDYSLRGADRAVRAKASKARL
ncbi:MAG: epoxyqueuosine reductase QueH [Porphyromonadaceae bacterium]|nr:epoxyqueuosine reductase QueH [Porphyromonadaceae bacterium]